MQSVVGKHKKVVNTIAFVFSYLTDPENYIEWLILVLEYIMIINKLGYDLYYDWERQISAALVTHMKAHRGNKRKVGFLDR